MPNVQKNKHVLVVCKGHCAHYNRNYIWIKKMIKKTSWSNSIRLYFWHLNQTHPLIEYYEVFASMQAKRNEFITKSLVIDWCDQIEITTLLTIMKNKRCIQINLYSKFFDICLFVAFIPTSSKPNYLIPSLKNASF
jgi:hypothetical protein